MAVALPIIGTTVVKACNTNKLSLEDVCLANVEALANTEATACANASHCTKMENETCYYYVITGDHNKITSSISNHVHNGVD